MDGTALETRNNQINQNGGKKKKERKSGKLQARTPACRVIIHIIRECLCPLGHGGVLTKSKTFITIVDVIHALIKNLCNLNQNAGL